MTITEPTAGVEGDARRLGAKFHKLFSASVISNLGDGMSQVAYPWLASASRATRSWWRW